MRLCINIFYFTATVTYVAFSSLEFEDRNLTYFGKTIRLKDIYKIQDIVSNWTNFGNWALDGYNPTKPLNYSKTC